MGYIYRTGIETTGVILHVKIFNETTCQNLTVTLIAS